MAGRWSGKVGVFHPGTQHAFGLARALRDRGLLGWFATSLYHRPDRFPYRCLPGRARARLDRLFSERRDDGLDDAPVYTNGLWEWVFAPVNRVRALEALAWPLFRHRNAAFGRWLVGRPIIDEVDAIYGFNGCSFNVFPEAKARGKACIADQTIAFSSTVADVLAREHERNPAFFSKDIGAELRHLRGWLRDKEQAELRLADRVLVGCTYAAESCAQAGIAADKIDVTGYYAEPPTDAFVPRAKHRGLRLLYAGSVGPRKGIYYLLEAMKALKSRQIELTIVGWLDSPIEALAPYEGLFTHRPHVPRAELYEMYRSSDVFVFPSLCEGFGRVLIEAAAMGMAIIGTTATGAPDLFGNAECGALIEPGSVEALAESIERLAGGGVDRNEMGRNAWERSRDFSFERYTDKAVAAVSEALSARTGD